MYFCMADQPQHQQAFFEKHFGNAELSVYRIISQAPVKVRLGLEGATLLRAERPRMVNVQKKFQGMPCKDERALQKHFATVCVCLLLTNFF